MTEGQTIREDLDFEIMIAKLVHTRAHVDVYITFVLEEIAPFRKTKPRVRFFADLLLIFSLSQFPISPLLCSCYPQLDVHRLIYLI